MNQLFSKLCSRANAFKFLLMLSSALLLAACFPGFGDQGWLVFIALFPYLTCLFLIKGKRLLLKGFLWGYLGGFLFWVINLKWLLRMADLDFVPAYGAILCLFLMPGYLAFYSAIFGAIITKWGNPYRNKELQNQQTKTDSAASRIAENISKKKNETPSSNRFIRSIKLSKRSLLFALMHASLWAILEWVRSWMITGFSWNGLGVAFHDIPVLAQTAELVGVTGLSFFPLFISSILLQVIVRLYHETKTGKFMPHFDFMVAGLIIIAMFGFGVSRLLTLNLAEKKEVRFLIVQQNLSLNYAHGDSHQDNLYNYIELTKKGLTKLDEQNQQKVKKASKSIEKNEAFEVELDTVDFVVWPESALLWGINHAIEEKENLFAEVEMDVINRTLQLGSHQLISGTNEFHYPDKDGVQQGDRVASYNSIGFFKKREDSFRLKTSYKKNHLVVFGEYIPFRDFLPILEMIVGASQGGGAVGPNYASGNDTEPFNIKHNEHSIDFIGSVCFEDTVAHLTRRSIKKTDQIIINVTNDGWFGESAQPLQHFANARFRCIELRRPMVRSANTGLSCIINTKGSIKNADGSLNAIYDDQQKNFTEGTLYGKVKMLKYPPLTLYAIAGNWFIIACFMFLLFSFYFCRSIT